MAARRIQSVEKYIVVLRIIQPARIQEIIKMYSVIWDVEMTESLRNILLRIHKKMRTDGNLIGVRRGTYVLTDGGMEIAAKVVKERDIDNARMFLMKSQRKSYNALAGRLG